MKVHLWPWLSRHVILHSSMYVSTLCVISSLVLIVLDLAIILADVNTEYALM